MLHFGGVLGWQPQAVIRFSEALTGCPRPRCTDADLAGVLDEYFALRHGSVRAWTNLTLWGSADAALAPTELNFDCSKCQASLNHA